MFERISGEIFNIELETKEFYILIFESFIDVKKRAEGVSTISPFL